MKTLLPFVMAAFVSFPVFAVDTREVEYKVGPQVFKGYVATPNTKDDEKRPGVIVVHEWWGHNDYARKRAKMLAEAGYVALALDMYGDGKTAKHPSQAGEFAGSLSQNIPLAKERFLAALKTLQAEPKVDPTRIAAIGYCFGGSMVLEMARQGVDLDAVASFHGSLATSKPAAKGKVKAKVLVFTGADDPFVKKEEVEGFEKEMKAAKIDYSLVSYPGAMHSFTNPGADKLGKEFNLPLQYDKEADLDSWQKTLAAFGEAFKK